MKTITLCVGDRLKVIKAHPFGAPLLTGTIVKVIDFNRGNEGYDSGWSCPLVQTIEGDEWYTDLKDLFHYYKKETE